MVAGAVDEIAQSRALDVERFESESREPDGLPAGDPVNFDLDKAQLHSQPAAAKLPQAARHPTVPVHLERSRKIVASSEDVLALCDGMKTLLQPGRRNVRAAVLEAPTREGRRINAAGGAATAFSWLPNALPRITNRVSGRLEVAR
jgi:hypothetical protein